MKKLLTLLSAFCLMATCCACSKHAGQSDTPAPSAGGNSDVTETAPAETGEKTATPETIICSMYIHQGETFSEPIYSYELLPDRTARIAGYYGDLRDIVCIPESVDGYTVSVIGKHAIPDYPHNSEAKIYIPESVTVIESDAFDNIHTTVQFTLPETHPAFQIVDGALICPAEKRIIRGRIRGDYSIPEGIEQLDSHAFWGSNFTSTHIPGSVTKLGNNPFAACNTDADAYTSLRGITLAEENTALEIRDGVLFSREDHRLVWCFLWDYDKAMNYSIPEDVRIIDDCAFWRWNRTVSVTIPAGVAEVGIIPFRDQRDELILRLDENNEALSYVNGMLISWADQRLVCMIRSEEDIITIPEGTEIIGDYAFYYFRTMKEQKVILPDTVTVIGAKAFAGYQGPVSIPAGVRDIGCCAFSQSMSANESLSITGDVRIGSFAFSECSGIVILTTEGNIQIGMGAFEGCWNLQNVRIGGGETRVMPCAFQLCNRLERAEIGEGTDYLGAAAFRMCRSLQSVSLPASLKYIGEQALYNQAEQMHNEEYDIYTMVYSCSAQILVAAGSYAEHYCKDNGITYTCR